MSKIHRKHYEPGARRDDEIDVQRMPKKIRISNTDHGVHLDDDVGQKFLRH